MQQDKKQCVLVGTQLDFSALLHKNVRDFHFQADGITTDKICRKYRNFSNVQHFFSALLLFAKVNPLGENSAVLIGTCFQEEKTYKNHQLFLTNSTLPSASILSSKALFFKEENRLKSTK